MIYVHDAVNMFQSCLARCLFQHVVKINIRSLSYSLIYILVFLPISPSILTELALNFVEKWRSLSRYSSLAD
jgi:hypothetical protein